MLNNKFKVKAAVGAVVVFCNLFSLFALQVFADTIDNSANNTNNTSTTSLTAATKDTQNVRIGLVGSRKPGDILSIGSQNGFTLNENKSGTSQVLITNVGSKPMSVMKDVYFSVEKNEVKFITNGGVKAENWHIKVDNTVDTYEQADNLVVYYKARGLDVFTYYNGKWQVCTGIYDGFEAADYYLNILKSANPGVNFEVVRSNVKRLLVLNDLKKPVLLYDREGYELTAVPLNGGIFKLNNDAKKTYRGTLAIYRLSTGAFTAVNTVTMDQYLYGVVPYEIGGSSPLEALKAQAIAARNYACNSLNKYKSENYDMSDTTYDQVYGGYSGESANANKAVDETSGKLLKYNGKNAWIYYFSSSGGAPTEDVVNVWGGSLPYIKSVENKYESGNTYHFTWKTDLTLAKVNELLASKKIDVGTLTDLQVTKRSEAGRVISLNIIGTKGTKTIEKESTRTTFKLDSQLYDILSDADVVVKNGAENITTRLGGKSVISANGISTINIASANTYIQSSQAKIKANVSPTKFTFDGKGWGHAVGMSQDGAIGMAKAGYTYEQILTHFFPGTNII